ncbi:MAG: GNAT family N-acetyltransferase [Clostridiales bacterium]|nr:GNAT family N-acetyltransferase [Clostridiales bacterium]
MKIRHAAEPPIGLPAENTFEAFDELENSLGWAAVSVQQLPQLLPDRPLNLIIDADCRRQAEGALLGAATARALVLRREHPQLPARVYTRCPERDEARLALLRSIGFVPDDFIMRMTLRQLAGPRVRRAPGDLVEVRDRLEDAQEREYFLDRYALLFQVAPDEARAWLDGARQRAGFARFLLASDSGLAGEVVCWVERGEGEVGYVYTAPPWRRSGVAAGLMESARLHFLSLGLASAGLTVRRRIEPAVRLAASVGYRQSDIAMLLPGMDV